MTKAVAPGRILLECLQQQAGAGRRVDDLAEPARSLVELALAPVHQAVHAEGDGMLLEEQEVAA